MEPTTIGLIALALLNIGVLVFVVILVRSKKSESTTDGSFVMLQNQLHDLARSINDRVGSSSKEIHESLRTQLGESNRIVKEVTEGLTKLDETNRQVVGFADQLQHLQDILKNPKQRGVLGEYYLESVLQNVLPPKSFVMQYAFTNGEIVDAIVFVKDKIIPIDSKFSLENYNRILESRSEDERDKYEKLFKQDLKNRIDETSKYIRPEEDTMDFAFMFIPSEGVYYDLLINQVGAVKTNTRDLIEYAFDKKVIIVSPTSFLAYLQTVLQGLRSLHIEEQAKDIQKRVGELGKHLKAYEDFYQKLGNSLSTTVNHYNAGSKELGKIDKDIYRIDGERPGLDAPLVEKPREAE